MSNSIAISLVAILISLAAINISQTRESVRSVIHVQSPSFTVAQDPCQMPDGVLDDSCVRRQQARMLLEMEK